MIEVGSSGERRGRKGEEGRREERRDGRGGKGRGGMGLETKGGMGRGRDLLPVPNMCLWACTGAESIRCARRAGYHRVPPA